MNYGDIIVDRENGSISIEIYITNRNFMIHCFTIRTVLSNVDEFSKITAPVRKTIITEDFFDEWCKKFFKWTQDDFIKYDWFIGETNLHRKT